MGVGLMLIKSKCIRDEVHKEDGWRVCVMAFVRDHYKYDVWLQDLAPTIKLLNDWKHKQISWKEYEKRYLAMLKKKRDSIVELAKLVKKKKVVTLLCYEKDDEYCHRRLLKEFLERRLS